MADFTEEDYASMLKVLDPDPYDTWTTVGMALQAAGVPFSYWEDWSKGSSKFQLGECVQKWRTFKNDGGITAGTLVMLARDAGWEPPKGKSDPEAWIDYVQNRTHSKIEDFYNYVGLDGRYHHTKIRLRKMGGEKEFIQGWLRDGRFTFSGKEHPLTTKGTVFCASVSGIKKAIEKGEKIFITEGEKDVITLQKKGFIALTSGAAGSWSDEASSLLDGADVVILADNDGPGKRSASKIRKSLAGHAKSTKIILPSDEDHGDVTDYFEAGGTVEGLQAMIEGPEAQLEEDQKTAAVLDDGVVRQVNDEVSQLTTTNAIDLSQTVFDPVQFVVDDLIPPGASILAGPPKIKKSWTALDMCVSVASGTQFLGRNTRQCGVLYLALEDSENRIQSRMDKLLDGRAVPGDLDFAIHCQTLDGGLLDQLDDYCTTHPGTGLIVIDTLQRVRSGGSRSESAYAQDYREVGALKSFADEHKLAIVLVHHTRKMRDPSDDFMNISGTLGLTGAADCTIVMSKDPDGEELTKFSITGRDVTQEEYKLMFNKSNCRWQVVGTAEEVEAQRQRQEYDNNPTVQTIKRLLDQCGGEWSGNMTELIDASRYYNTPIRENAKALGRSIEKLSDSLWFNDRINYQTIKNGTGANKHRFWLQDNPYVQ